MNEVIQEFLSTLAEKLSVSNVHPFYAANDIHSPKWTPFKSKHEYGLMLFNDGLEFKSYKVSEKDGYQSMNNLIKLIHADFHR